MNKKVIVVMVLTLVALVVLTLFSFGPLSNLRKSSSINPASLQPSTTNTITLIKENITLDLYTNQDVKENYYGIDLPKDWQVKAGGKAGSYSITFPQGSGSVQLQDVADNTTLELFVLSQAEPLLKKTVSGYIKKEYLKTTIGNNEAHEIVYDSNENGKAMRTIKTYIVGSDNAGMITFSADSSSFETLRPLFMQIINSFNWQN
jgi:hypothetical protein